MPTSGIYVFHGWQVQMHDGSKITSIIETKEI